MNYLKLTLQEEIIKKYKKTNIANFLNKIIRQYEIEKGEKPSKKSTNTAPLHMG